MTDTYMDHFTSYAHDIQWRLKKAEEETLEQLTQLIPMSDEHKIDLSDRLRALHFRCCSESFTLGIELGLRLAVEFPAK